MREVMEHLLDLYGSCYDIERPFTVGDTVYDAYASCDVTSSRYVLVKSAELWRVCTFEHVFIREIDGSSEEALRRYESQLREVIEPGFVRKGERYPVQDHMCSYLTGIFICRSAVSEEVLRHIRRHRFRIYYKLALRGYCESRLAVFDLEKGRIYGNRAAKPLIKRYRHLNIGGLR